MNTHVTIGLSMLVVGAVIGAAAVQELHAQGKAPVYQIAEIDVTNPEGFAKDYAPRVQALLKSMGGRYVVAGGAKITAEEGQPPKRVAISTWDSLEKIHAFYNSAEYKELRKTGDKYAKFHIYAVEGLAQ